MRDVQELLNRIEVIEQRTIEQLYAEPIVLGNMPEEPFAIHLARISNLTTPTSPVTQCSGLTHWTWLPALGGAQIANISGMTVASDGATRFRFYFRIIYKLG